MGFSPPPTFNDARRRAEASVRTGASCADHLPVNALLSPRPPNHASVVSHAQVHFEIRRGQSAGDGIVSLQLSRRPADMPRPMAPRVHQRLVCGDAQNEHQGPADQVPDVMRLQSPRGSDRRVENLSVHTRGKVAPVRLFVAYKTSRRLESAQPRYTLTTRKKRRNPVQRPGRPERPNGATNRAQRSAA